MIFSARQPKRPLARRSARLLVLAALLVVGTGGDPARAVDVPSPAEGRIADRAITAIGRHYFDPERIRPELMLDDALQEMQRKIPELLITEHGADLTVMEGLAQKRVRARPMERLADLARVLHETLAFVLPHFQSDGQLKPEEIEFAAIDGMLEALDPHSNFLPPKVYNEFKVGTAGKFGGLGIVISIKDGLLTVVAPIEGTPAARAGVRAGDRIAQIDDDSTINMSLTDAVNKLRGDVGTKVSIVLDRPGKPARRLTLTRALINIDSVQYALLEDAAGRIGYVKVKSFQDNTADDVRTALEELQAGGKALSGLILDLRNNPGGLLNVAVDVADLFIRKGVIVATVGPNDQLLEQDLAHAAGNEPDYPVVALINEGSASASEIVAGALAANDRAVVMGRRSFGKGSVQTIFELGGDTALKLTIAQYKPAGTLPIQLAGVTPDIELLPTTVDPEAMNIVEDKLPSERDLEMHLGGDGGGSLPSAAYRVPYLQPKEDEKALEERSIKEYAKTPEIAGDFAVQFARTLLASAGSLTRQKTLEQAGPVVEEQRRAQEAEVTRALAALGIDWQPVPASGEPKLAIAYHLLRGGERIARARAGEKVRLELTATNSGTGPFSQLVAVGDAQNPLLADREFPFGRLDPGATRTFSTPLELPDGLSTQDLSMELSFREGHGRIPKPVRVIVPVVEEAQPAFGFLIQPTGAAGGAPLAEGASVPLLIDIQNTGAGGSSPDTAATLSNDCGDHLFIERGRVTLGAMAPKAKRRATFRFHATGSPASGECAVKLTVADLKHFVVLTKRMPLSMDRGAIRPAPGTLYAPPRIELASSPSSTEAAQVTLTGTISDADPVRDSYVFVGKRKVAYIPNADETNAMPLSLTLPLEPGTNQIVIGARDREDLVGRKFLVIERTSGQKPKGAAAPAPSAPPFMP